MEGTSTLSRRRLRRLIWCVLLCCLVAGTAFPDETYLIVERPSALVIYDRYQQVLGLAERTDLGNFVPFRILNAHDRLGDGITPCTSVELGGAAYYILQETSGRFAGESAAGELRRLTGATPLADSVEILRTTRIQDPSGRAELPLPAGEHVARIFRSGERTYVLRHGVHVSYGWVVFRESDWGQVWTVLAPKPEPAVALTPRLAELIRGRIDRANRVLTSLYAFFNAQYRQHRVAPVWSVQSDAEGVVCLLSGDPAGSAESTRALAHEIENVVLGSRLRVDAAPGRISIHPG